MDIRLKTILQHAIMAPSGDNCQPWNFKVDGLTIDLWNNAAADSSLYNLKQRASLIAHGALLENIRQTAPAVGLMETITLLPNRENADHIAHIELTEGPEDESALFQAIPERHTNRERYQPVNISDKQIEQWQNLTERDGDHIWIGHKNDQIRQLADLLSLNDRLVFEVADLHRFLFEQLRWNDDEARRTNDGLDIKTLGLNPLDQLSFPILKNFRLISSLNKVGFSRIIQMKAKQTLRSASAVAMITISGTDNSDYIYGGMLWQRLLLQLASEGLTTQPIAGLACLMQAETEGLLGEKLTQPQRGQLRRVRQELMQQAGDENAVILSLFRIGQGPKVIRALRRPLSEFLIV